MIGFFWPQLAGATSGDKLRRLRVAHVLREDAARVRVGSYEFETKGRRRAEGSVLIATPSLL